MEYAKFLQETVQEMAREVQNSRSGEIKKTAEDLDEFLNRVSAKYQFVTKDHVSIILVRLLLCSIQVRTGAGVSNEEILGFAKLFNDELTLDNISRFTHLNFISHCFR